MPGARQAVPAELQILAPTLLFCFSLPWSAAAATFRRHSRILSVSNASRIQRVGLGRLWAEDRRIQHQGRSLRYVDPLDTVWPRSSLYLNAEPAQCHSTYPAVTSKSEPHFSCPAECPLMAQDKTSVRERCRFQCVDNSIAACKALNPHEPVADDGLGYCRACSVTGCDVCTSDGKDTCAKCMTGFALDKHGQCYNKLWWVWWIVFGVLSLVLLPVVIWAVDLSCRKITNEEGLRRGMNARSRAKFHMPVDPDRPKAPRKLYPWYTNLCREDVGGPGLLLQFNFQAILIVWALVLTAVWAGFILFVDSDLAVLGTRRADTPWENCWVVQWGTETQVELLWAKLAFASFVYLFSFVGVILFGIRQLRITQLMDENSTTHMDYCAVLTGIPLLDGKERIEEELLELLEEQSHRESARFAGHAVGVSVCWDIGDKIDICKSILEVGLDARDLQNAEDDEEDDEDDEEAPSPSNLSSGLKKKSFKGDDAEKTSLLRRALNYIESLALSPGTQWFIGKSSAFKDLKEMHSAGEGRAPDSQPQVLRRTAHSTASLDESPRVSKNRSSDAADVEEVDTLQMLHEFTTSGQAFIVFQTEVERDKGVAAAKSNPLIYRGCQLELVEARVEPESVLWANIQRVTLSDRLTRAAKGFGIIFAALFVWTFGFYLPYAYYAMSFNYAQGQEPGMVETLSFSMVVVAGNAIMYVVCSEVADRQRYKVLGDRETCYLLLYTFACVFNVVLDLYIAYRVAYRMMVGSEMQTYRGTPLEDVSSFSERFETYAMQREMGETLMGYAFPSTFLIPFLLEPIVTIMIPFNLMVWFVRTHPELTGLDCERCMKALPMDLSRYADVLLNVILAVMILYFPGGFNIKMFLTMALSHMYIYVFDHWRVLYSVPACKFSKIDADWWAQWMCSVPIGLVLSCIVFKAHTEGLDADDRVVGAAGHIEERQNISLVCVGVFLAHVLVHTLVLVYAVPLFGKQEKAASEESYEHCAKHFPCTWFSSNPAHCLRSEYVYNHRPPSDYYIHGKEHLIRQNKNIGVYFAESDKSEEEIGYREMLSRMHSEVFAQGKPAAPG